MLAVFLAIVTLALCLAVIVAAYSWWPSALNPVLVGAIAWAPALVMLNFPPNFLSAVYIHLNMPISGLVFLAIAMAFVSFWLGCIIVRTLSPAGSFDHNEERILSNFSPLTALALYAVGFVVFVYSFTQSGLLSYTELDSAQIADARTALYLGWVNFVILLMDICSFALFAYAIKVRRLAWTLPFFVALIAYGATLQKTAIMWFVVGALTAAFLQPRAAFELFWRPVAMRVTIILGASLVVAGLFFINDLRGISDFQLTAASSPWFEQFYIYSGASAIMNLSTSIDQYLPSTPQSFGQMLLRPLFWLLMDPDSLSVARYFEGVNTGTYLLYGWSDFRWLGFVVTPLVAGILAMMYLRIAMRGSFVGLILAAIVLRAMVFSPSTDILFDPTTTITIVIAAITSFACRRTFRSGSTHAVSPYPNGPMMLRTGRGT
ncbi:MAG: oligosaccharide repeat unit polymerase [Tsuneonella sp.]